MKKIILSLVAVIATITAFAAGKALIITLKDGSTVNYNLDTIEDLHFGKASLPMGELTSAPYAPGDYFCDGTIQGIVITVDPKGNFGTLCAVEDAGRLPWATWGDYEWVETGAQNEDDGKANQQKVASLEPSLEHYPAFRACADEGDGWYLPAIHEIQGLYKILDTANATLEAHGFSTIDPSSFYWSSTEAVEYTFADGNAMGIFMNMIAQIGTDKNSAGNVRAFHDFGEAPAANFTIGQLYDKDGVKGVIYWVDETDSYARVISLDETTAAWGPTNTTTGASSENDGEANTNKIRKADATFANYPAFAGCNDPWYLPSKNEFTAISENIDAVNATLSANNGTPITPSAFYWSSTEATANNAAQVLMASNTSTFAAKSAVKNVRKVAFVGDRPVNESYSIGDPYYDGDAVVGIVCAVSDDGQHGTILALHNVVQTGRINALWATTAFEEINAGADSEDDGEYNMSKFAELDATFANFPALQVTAALGEGWYIGALNEMTNVASNISVINAAMSTYGDSTSPLNSNDYWTSTEYGEGVRVHTVDPVNGVVDKLITRKYGFNQVRPMKKF